MIDDNLIERLEAATEGSRELDAAIWVTILPRSGHRPPLPEDRRIPQALAPGYDWSYEPRENGRVEFYPEKAGKRGMCCASRDAPYFTTSLDAALTVVPKGSPWSINDDRGRSPVSACVVLVDGEFCDGEVRAHAPTPALALCIAATKARAQ